MAESQVPGEAEVKPLGEVEVVPLSRIRPYPANARNIPAKAVEQTALSIKRFGWQQPIVADAEYVIIAGHVRWRAAKRLGLAEVPVKVARDLSADEVRAYRIADNRSHEYATWDYHLLARELDGLDGFADVLDLADWRTIISEFEANPPALDLGGSEESLFGHAHTVTVFFSSEEEADRAGPEILKLAGVLDVRYSR